MFGVNSLLTSFKICGSFGLYLFRSEYATFNRFADPFNPKLNLLPRLFKSNVYEKSTLNVFSSITPNASFTKLTPSPTLLSAIGVFTENEFVVGAPSKPTH